jgi:hypothetical protein
VVIDVHYFLNMPFFAIQKHIFVSALSSNRLIILRVTSGKGNKSFSQKLPAQTLNKPRSP